MQVPALAMRGCVAVPPGSRCDLTLSAFLCMLLLLTAMSKSAVKISSDLLSNPLCEQEPSFLEMVTAFDTAMKRMDSFNQEKVNMGLAEEGETRGCWWYLALPDRSSFPFCHHLQDASHTTFSIILLLF